MHEPKVPEKDIRYLGVVMADWGTLWLFYKKHKEVGDECGRVSANQGAYCLGLAHSTDRSRRGS